MTDTTANDPYGAMGRTLPLLDLMHRLLLPRITRDMGLLMGPGGVFEVDDAKVGGDTVLHVGRIRNGRIAVGEQVTAQVCPRTPSAASPATPI